MTVSKGFNFRVARRGLRRTFVGARREDGSSLFEFAMVLPVLSMLLIGIIFGGITFYDYTILANAVADGAAALAQARASQASSAPCTAAIQMVKTSTYTLNQSLVNVATPTFTAGQNATVASGCTLTSGTNPLNGNACTVAAPCQALVQGNMGTISATYPCNLTIPFSGLNLCPSKGAAACGTGVASCISAQTTIRIE